MVVRDDEVYGEARGVGAASTESAQDARRLWNSNSLKTVLFSDAGTLRNSQKFAF